ncbi:MAG: SDR family oxidoreductase, partial [Steroidobacteraceae bacterium]|nr:SDR family oxidoreductase [Steroidobacteraceae bacterium]MDW8259714.1 SDR family oxidoreductase [Gammaproteobacteria bacterium]
MDKRLLLACVGAAALSLAACAAKPAPQDAALVLVVGATGGTGQEIVKQALANGYSVRAFVRDEAKARQLFGDRVQYHVGDVRNAASIAPALRGVAFVISALGSNSVRDPENKPELVDFGAVRDLANAARAARVRQFVLVSSMGVTQPDHRLNKLLDNILIWKLRGEDALRASGVPYTIVRPGGLRDAPAGAGGIRALQGDPRDVIGSIARADVAAICVRALGEPAALGKTFEVI